MLRMKIAILAAALALVLPASAQTRRLASTSTCAVPDQPVAVTHCEAASIYVADFDRSAIEQILGKRFDGFTILPARGCWHKVCESSLVIQIAGARDAELRQAAEELRVAGKQQSVLVVIPLRQVPRR